MLQVGRSGVRTQVGGTIVLVQTVTTRSGAKPASIQWCWCVLSRVLSGCGFKLTTHLPLVPRLRMSGVRPHLPYMTSRRPQGQRYLYLSYFVLSNLKVKKKIHLYTNLQYIKSVFPHLFSPGPLLASKNNHGSSHPVLMIGLQNSKFMSWN